MKMASQSEFEHRGEYYGSSGSYFQMFLGASLMAVPFSIALAWIFLYGDEIIAVHSEEKILLTGGIIIGLGWMMAIIIGIGFDILPFVHGNLPLDNSILRITISLNVSGQLLIITGIISSSAYWFGQLALIGVTLLVAQLWLLLPPALATVRAGKSGVDSDLVGAWSFMPTLIVPFIATLAFIGWLMPLNRIAYELAWFGIVDFFFVTISFSFIISHFNRRLGWAILDPKRIRLAFRIFMLTQLLHLIALLANATGTITDHRIQVTVVIPILVMWFMIRPGIIYRKALSGEPHSRFILTGYSLMLVAASLGIFEILLIERDTGMMNFRYFILLGVACQILFGYGHHLHQDHKHKSLQERNESWLVYLPINISIGGLLFSILIDGLGWSSETVEGIQTLMPLGFLISSAIVFVWLIREFQFKLYDWQRIPMFWGELQESLDPYEFDEE
jgi:hypothetical protein